MTLTSGFARAQVPDVAAPALLAEIGQAEALRQAGRHSEADQQLTAALEILATKGGLLAPGDRARVLAASLNLLVAQGQNERAFGLARAAGAAALQALPATGMDKGALALALARTYEVVGAAEAALACADLALSMFDAAPRSVARDDLRAEALNLKVFTSIFQDDFASATSALKIHPYAQRLAKRAPAEPSEFAYLAGRALTAAVSGTDDPAASAGLSRAADPAPPGDFYPARLFRRLGVALAEHGPAQARAGLGLLGLQLIERADFSGAVEVAGAWYRPTSLERRMAALSIMTAGHGLPDGLAFALMQLEGRRGEMFEYDALSALSQARDEAARRAIRDALRLKAQRDRLERTALQGQWAEGPGASAAGALGELNARLFNAKAAVESDGNRLSGADLVGLKDFQAVLAEDEAALLVTPSAGWMTWLCVRRDQVQARSGPVDTVRTERAVRLLSAALTAGHAPSEELDSQFPVEAAMQLHRDFIAPFEGCLRDKDRIVWLSGMDMVGGMLGTFLPAAPPRQGAGHDLSRADWLIRRHGISYAGSAGLIYAARTAPARAAQSRDFLGVGDPVLTGIDAAAQPRTRLPAGRAAEVGALAPLPETADELRASAEGFQQVRLLLGADATEARVRPEMTGDYRYMSFATHGLMREDLQGLSDPALVLTAADGQAGDGLLTAAEIAEMDLKASFIALSACNTANFDQTQIGQDLPALASAFALAGAPSTLATLWPVETETGKQVVSDVFKGLRAGLGPAEALAQAQRAYLARPPGPAYLHPRFWAPFVILGEGGR